VTVIPFQLDEREYSVFVVLGDDGVERIKAYDPAQLNIWKLPEYWRRLRLRDVLIGYATPADIERMMEMIQRDGNPLEALRFLSRGFEFRPADGDHDGPYLSAKPDGGTKH
jgi:hypothetical protein